MESFIYSFRVWMTSFFLGPLVYYPVQLIMEPQYPHRFGYGLSALIFLFSLPSFILSIFIVALVRAITINQFNRKLILSIAGILLTAMPLYLLGWKQQFTEYTIVYGSIVVIGIWFYNFNIY